MGRASLPGVAGAGSFLSTLVGKAGDIARILIALATGNSQAAQNAFKGLPGKT